MRPESDKGLITFLKEEKGGKELEKRERKAGGQEGRKEGREEGRKEGREEGKKKGLPPDLLCYSPNWGS